MATKARGGNHGGQRALSVLGGVEIAARPHPRPTTRAQVRHHRRPSPPTRQAPAASQPLRRPERHLRKGVASLNPAHPDAPLLCHKCGERPVLPSRCHLKRGSQYCCTCHNRASRGAHQRKWARYTAIGYNREHAMAYKNPRRAAYRAIGLEAFNLAMGRKWNGKARSRPSRAT